MKVISEDEAYEKAEFGGYVLTPAIEVMKEGWQGGHTYILITFYDYYTGNSVAAVQSKTPGLNFARKAKTAVKAIERKLKATFGAGQ